MAANGDEDEQQRFPSADYVLVLPLQLDAYDMPVAESYRDRVEA